MNLLEKQLSTVYFKDVRFPWVTLYYSYLNIGVDGLVGWTIRDQELHILVFYLTGSRPDVFQTHVGGTH